MTCPHGVVMKPSAVYASKCRKCMVIKNRIAAQGRTSLAPRDHVVVLHPEHHPATICTYIGLHDVLMAAEEALGHHIRIEEREVSGWERTGLWIDCVDDTKRKAFVVLEMD